jgi:hypothetical protein
MGSSDYPKRTDHCLQASLARHVLAAHPNVLRNRLFFDQDGQDEYTEANLPPSMTSYDAKYLLAGTTYQFQGNPVGSLV